MNKKEQAKILLIDSRKFRASLVENMILLEKQNISCKSCSGICCTVSRNSMMVTPVEAIDLYFYLEENIKNKVELKNKIEDAIKQFGLDREIYIKNKLMRKNYTCPLFKFESWGCPVDAHLKPLGCLGYNATIQDVKDGEYCSSDVNLLSLLESQIKLDWDEANRKLIELLSLDFEKTSIPMAIQKIDYAFNL